MKRMDPPKPHRHFEIRPDELAVECTNVAARTSNIVAEPAKKTSDGSYIETVWRFKNNRPVAVTVCEQRSHYDKGDRSVHVKVGR